MNILEPQRSLLDGQLEALCRKAGCPSLDLFSAGTPFSFFYMEDQKKADTSRRLDGLIRGFLAAADWIQLEISVSVDGDDNAIYSLFWREEDGFWQIDIDGDGYEGILTLQKPSYPSSAQEARGIDRPTASPDTTIPSPHYLAPPLPTVGQFVRFEQLEEGRVFICPGDYHTFYAKLEGKATHVEWNGSVWQPRIYGEKTIHAKELAQIVE